MEVSQCEQHKRSFETTCIPPVQLPEPIHDDAESAASAERQAQRLIIDGKGSNWHQSPILALQSTQEKERKSLDTLPILDFDLLCARVAMQSEPLSLEIQRDGAEVGVQRMWEGGVLDCLDDTDIAVQTLCCPCVTFGKSLHRAGFGSCLSKGGIYLLQVAGAVISYALFLLAYGHLFLYLALVLLVSVAAYTSFYRIQIRQRFNIKGSDSDRVISGLDDSLNHFLCGCCTLCQEARTLEMNNVQEGNWHGRGDTMWVGSYAMAESQIAESTELKPPVVITISTETRSQESGGHSWKQSQECREPLVDHPDELN